MPSTELVDRMISTDVITARVDMFLIECTGILSE